MYYANFTANNGTSFKNPITGNNKKNLIRDIRNIAEGERFLGNKCFWSVRDDSGIYVAAGGVDSNGRRYRL